MKLALIRNGIVENVIVPPEGEWAAPEGVTLVECDDNDPVGPGHLYDGKTFAPPPAPVPEVVSMRQARLALLAAGLLATVDAAIGSLPSPAREAAQIEWEYAAQVARDSALIVGLMPALGMSAEQIDDLFRLAASL